MWNFLVEAESGRDEVRHVGMAGPRLVPDPFQVLWVEQAHVRIMEVGE